MTACSHRRVQVLAAGFCLLGALAGADAGSSTWSLVTLAACTSALLMVARYRSDRSAVVTQSAEATR